MNARLAMLALPLALAACGGQGDFRMPWDKTPPPAAETAAPAEPARPSIPEPTGAAPTVQALQVAGETKKLATADAETLGVQHFVASGTGWKASVSGNAARFERPGAKPAAIAVRRIPYSGGVEYIGVLGEQPFVLRVRAANCGDQPLTASLRARGTNYSGCATPTAAMSIAVPKEAPAKPAAPKKAAAKPKPAATTPAAPAATTPAASTPVTTTPAASTPAATPSTTTPSTTTAPAATTPVTTTPLTTTPAPTAPASDAGQESAPTTTPAASTTPAATTSAPAAPTGTTSGSAASGSAVTTTPPAPVIPPVIPPAGTTAATPDT